MGGIAADTGGGIVCLCRTGQAYFGRIVDPASAPQSIRATACSARRAADPNSSRGTAGTRAEGAPASGVSLGIEAPAGMEAGLEVTSYSQPRRRSVPVSRVSVLPE